LKKKIINCQIRSEKILSVHLKRRNSKFWTKSFFSECSNKLNCYFLFQLKKSIFIQQLKFQTPENLWRCSSKDAKKRWLKTIFSVSLGGFAKTGKWREEKEFWIFWGSLDLMCVNLGILSLHSLGKVVENKRSFLFFESMEDSFKEN
jgi:hypothetical protein